MTLDSTELSALIAAALVLFIVALLIARARSSSRDEALAAELEFGPYRVERRIGEGGMGVVYEAEDLRRRKAVAIKLIRGTPNTTRLERFEHEIRLLGGIRHPNVVTLYDHGWTSRGARYLVMERLEGTDLQRLLDKHGALEPERVVEILVGVCDALAEVHANGLVHGDIKAANVFLHRNEDGTERVKLLDFGLARNGQSEDGSDADEQRMLGSPPSMAPECFTQPSSVGYSADLYAVGVFAYTLLAGTPPFSGNLIELATQHLYAAPPSLAARSPYRLSDELRALVASCLEKRESQRPSSARALRRALFACPEARRHEELRAAA